MFIIILNIYLVITYQADSVTRVFFNECIQQCQELVNHIKVAMATEGNPLYAPEWAEVSKDHHGDVSN